ncbi:MalY/PatB family protein [Campylobacter gastrosuis]|uniref:cysteine-S-conjugate beta-lyase n=1 Tax=Campylobacter gastrosuis TaxID=2974576 RepID=A0ABT7HLW8_9BACT|nr:PatB family C-S lyase [Campylobacter gastrosuis]MDL0087775.1 PatB family C-S lyase [Campylobacter gastrosuis]MDL0087986.1 PatB family C-S lyase [Campylobacter gastrosuis]
MSLVDDFVREFYVERKGTNSLKHDALKRRFGDENLLGMWVADMDFKTPNEITNALNERVNHGVYGYSFVGDEYFDAFFSWQKDNYGVELKREWIRFNTGVVSAIYLAINAFTKPNDSVMIITPVYYPFKNSIIDNDRNLICSEALLKNGEYELDFDDIEQKIRQNNVKLFIHSSPHNPLGKVWSDDELSRLFEILTRHNVLIISDEIHQDFMMSSKPFISALNVQNGKFSDNLIVMTSASKTFNLACLLHSVTIFKNEKLAKIYDEMAKRFHQTETSILGVIAATFGYKYGKKWLESLKVTINFNYEILTESFKNENIEIFIAPLEGTYLAWLDLNPYTKDTKDFMQRRCGLAIDYGEWFGKNAKGFIRINLATKPEIIKTATTRIIKEIKANF